MAIREDRDYSPDERLITFCNGGVMAIKGKHALSLLEAIDNRNSKREILFDRHCSDCTRPIPAGRRHQCGTR